MRQTLLFVLISFSISLYAQFSGNGAGTEKDPYLVSNAEELFEVRNDLSAHYKQIDNIDLRDWISEESPNYGWPSIGTYSNPFSGNYDGNNHSIKGLLIKRGNNDCIGLFGCVVDAKIKNLAIVNPLIEGNNDVGACVGRCCYSNECNDNGSIEDIVVISGKIKGNNHVAAIAGSVVPYTIEQGAFPRLESLTFTTMINRCYSSAKVEAENICAGICAYVVSGDYYYYSSSGSKGRYYQCYKVEICDNRCDGLVCGTNNANGILGYSEAWSASYHVGQYAVYENLRSNMNIKRNIFAGSLEAKGANAVGIVTLNEGVFEVTNNYCNASDLIASQNLFRVTGQSGYPENYGYNGITTIINGKDVVLEDNDNNGISYGKKTLMKQSTYEGTAFDFNNIWTIIEGNSYPYNKKQDRPAIISKFVAGTKGFIEGHSENSGKVYAIINENLYETSIIDGEWHISLGNIAEGERADVYIQADGRLPSLYSSAYGVIEAIVPDLLDGDANGDGVVDAADVVSIINYIIGKPSASFNEKNADTNGDGLILVDDAVGTANIIMNEQ